MAKKQVNYYIDKDVVEKFNEVAEEKSINKSKWIEKQMYLFIKESSNG